MSRHRPQWPALFPVAGVALALQLMHGVAAAATDEAYVERALVEPGNNPLLTLLVDTSAAMTTVLAVVAEYDPTRDYRDAGDDAANCDPGRIYWRRGAGPAPDCASGGSVAWTASTPELGLRCSSAVQALATTGVFVAARLAQWQPRGATGYWREPTAGSEHAIECVEDRGHHGQAAGSWYAANGGTQPWARDARLEPRWNAPPLADPYVLFSGNYLNYLASARTEVDTTTYDWLRRRIVDAARSVAALDFALARFSHDGGSGDAAAEGGMLVLPPLAAPAAAPVLDAWLGAWRPAGPAPLAEATAELARWFAGSTVHFGLASQAEPGAPLPSAPAAIEGVRYRSPFVTSCRAATLALATAGAASADDSAEDSARALGALQDPERCSEDCLARLLAWMTGSDLRADVPGRQFLRVRAVAPVPSNPRFERALGGAGTAAVDVRDPLALVMLAAAALGHDAAVASAAAVGAPAIGRNAGDPGQSAFFYAVGRPAARSRWTGNVHKLRLGQPRLQPADAAGGAVGDSLLDPATGALGAGGENLWPGRPGDPDAVATGGAAARLPPPAARRLYSNLSGADLADPANHLDRANPSITRAMLGLAAHDPRSVSDLIEWAQGRDVFDADHDGDTLAVRADLGDAGRSAPLLLHYDGPADGGATLFVMTADGFLHAFDAGTGAERWAFVARELLARLGTLAGRFDTFARPPGPDGGLALHVHDANRDGRIRRADGDAAWLYVGLGEATPRFLGLDVTDPERPQVLWTLGVEDLPWLASAVAAPVVSRLAIGGTDAVPRPVVLLAGGADPAEAAGVSAGDGRGAGLAVVDAATGAIHLTVADTAAGDADAPFDGAASFAAGPRAVDSDGDGTSDRLYALDLRGGLWRIDLPGGEAPVVRLLGRFGEAAQARFHAPVDVVATRRFGAPAFLLAFGSGWLDHPREQTITDSFYVVLDGPGAAAGPLDDADLADVTAAFSDTPPQVSGWRYRLAAHGPGEKVIGASLTIDHRVRFTTYQPLDLAAEEPCGPPRAVTRLYTLDLVTGRPLHFVDEAPEPAEELPLAGLPPALRIALPWQGSDADCGEDCRHRPMGLVGATPVPLDWLNEPVRTSWRELDLAAE